MCGCMGGQVCDYHFAEIKGLYHLLREAERHDTGIQELLRLALAQYGSKVDRVILAIETRKETT